MMKEAALSISLNARRGGFGRVRAGPRGTEMRSEKRYLYQSINCKQSLTTSPAKPLGFLGFCLEVEMRMSSQIEKIRTECKREIAEQSMSEDGHETDTSEVKANGIYYKKDKFIEFKFMKFRNIFRRIGI